MLDHEPEQGSDQSELLAVPTLEGRVQLQDLGYQPPEASEPILSGINLDVAPGTTVAIVGRSGSGKSTLLRLLAGLLEPTTGTILFDRIDSRRLRYGDLRRQVGFVLQQPYVFAATIGDNIALGDESAGSRRDPLGRRGRRPVGARRAPARSATTPLSATVAFPSRAARHRGWRSPVPSTAGRPCCCSTRRRAHSTSSRSRS